MHIAMIAAIDKNRLIGNGPHIPWQLPADLRHFRDMTIGKPVVMGRKTFETLPRPLAKRKNIILTRNPNYKTPEGCIVAHSVEEVIKTAETLTKNNKDSFLISENRSSHLQGNKDSPLIRETGGFNRLELMICGGAPIYAAFLPYANRLYLTQIHAIFDGDVYFPEFNMTEWQEVQRIDCKADAKNPYPYSFLFLEKK